MMIVHTLSDLELCLCSTYHIVAIERLLGFWASAARLALKRVDISGGRNSLSSLVCLGRNSDTA